MRIQIKEIARSVPGYISIELTIDGSNRFQVEFENPHNAKTEENLEWYFEDYINEPYAADTKVNREKKRIVDYGLDLFNQLFADKKAHGLYKKGLNEGYENMVFEIVSEGEAIEFQSVIWEALRDPDLRSEPLIAKGIGIFRKSLKAPALEAQVKEHPAINLLIVTARPSEENDIGYRTIQRPMVDIIAKTGVRVNPFILRPGTYKALKEHLKEKKGGFYHIIHFDLHGEIFSYEELLEERKEGKAFFSYNHSFGKTLQTFQVRFGREDIEPFDGKKAFLFFETKDKGVAEPATAREVAELIRDARVPICILNACQSAKQEGLSSETSLAKTMQEEGVALVLAMRYSVSVSAAKLLMERLYRDLFRDKPIEDAIASGRRLLHDDKNRHASLGYEIELEDWVLPVIYQRQPVDFKIRTLKREEEEQWLLQKSRMPAFPQFKYEFYGRDLDILKIEKLLLSNNHLLLRGMIGVGKSALLKYLTAWWRITNFREIKNAIYIDFAEKKYSYPQFINTLAKPVFLGFKSKNIKEDGLAYWAAKLLERLNQQPNAIILDNIFEFDNSSIIEFLSRLTGHSFAVYGSVNGEEKLQPVTFKDNIYFLDGLDKNAAFQLAGDIIRTKANKEIKDLIEKNKFETEHLLKLLMGFPLAMEVVLPFLKAMTVGEVLDGFRNGTLNIEF